MAVVERQGAVVAVTDNNQVGLVEGERFEVRNFGKTVHLRNTIYGKTNFFIDQSRDYVGDHKLTRYDYIIYIQWVYLLVFLISLLAPLNFIFAFVMAGINALFFRIWIQHAHVSVGTMPHVLKQPSLPNHMLNCENEFFEITLEKYAALFASSKNAGIGIAATAKGTVKIQVFKIASKNIMKKCILVSSVALFGCSFVFIYCLAMGMFGTIRTV